MRGGGSGDRFHVDEVDDEHAARLERGAGQALSRADVVPVVQVRARTPLQAPGRRSENILQGQRRRSENILQGQRRRSEKILQGQGRKSENIIEGQ